jgi:hypothetical protein
LKNVPDAVYAGLKAQAEENRRSLNQEVIACLEQLARTKHATSLLARADALREELARKGASVTAAEIDAWIEAGRR